MKRYLPDHQVQPETKQSGHTALAAPPRPSRVGQPQTQTHELGARLLALEQPANIVLTGGIRGVAEQSSEERPLLRVTEHLGPAAWHRRDPAHHKGRLTAEVRELAVRSAFVERRPDSVAEGERPSRQGAPKGTMQSDLPRRRRAGQGAERAGLDRT